MIGGRRQAVLAAICAATLVVTTSCKPGDRPPLGRVRGTVTIDGAPASGLGVVFSQPGYRSSSGLTNDVGEYELTYIKEVKGAVVGPHQVRIEVLSHEGDEDGPRSIPARYNRETELTADVERGSNRIDFALESQ